MPHALVTGTSRGPGRALAHGFSAVAWTVSACATDLSPTNSARSIVP
jgi:NAD(P)-dependent dehydrogenase (short-subunit alcohol dehydrogenase family)